MGNFNFYTLIAGSCVLALVILAWKVLNFMLLTPRKIEKFLRSQGLNGNSYKPFLGDLNELGMMLGEAYSKPINLSDDIVPRVIPFFIKTFKEYGNFSNFDLVICVFGFSKSFRVNLNIIKY